MRRSSITFTLFLAGMTAMLPAQSAQSISGTVTDSMCGTHHMMKNASAAQCTRACVKGGSSYALASGDKVYTLKGDAAMLDKWAGQSVTVQGRVDGTTITVDSMKAN